ncbi:GNAT family N-acetyltransferase [Arsenicibacter rosenii]|uniref:GNAT family N-acetyltransferase n=1 Tax=Arsenicibacter rosenii TaxID=1750698 RepID=A0A1S2VAZ0_9BACT|nr:GNAT family N-acetyltransferase [Arsenicibacter rosenii]OIN55894.1 GNAT family N-acetyltransferase [Arsenicibacter rosenii]
MGSLSFVRKQGAGIGEVFEALASLRITVFRDFPYLYEGSKDYEKAYLQTYARAERAFLFAVYDGPVMVGATTCIPLINETAEVRKPFENAGMAVDRIFYFGESMLLKTYRGLGLGHRFFDEREAHARHFGMYEATCFCAVDRGDHHPAKPADYRPNDAFWLKRGYRKVPALQSKFDWPDIGETVSTPKPMIYWMRPLTQ